MQDTKVIPIKERYRYNLFINTKAIWDFLVLNKTQSIVINTTQIHVLSFLVAMATTQGITFVTDELGIKYIYVTDNFILNNLKFLGVQRRQLKNILRQLESAKTIERKILDNNKRYVRVHPKLLDLWHVDNWTTTASAYMAKHMPRLWESLQSDWQPQLGADGFKEVIDWCNSQIDIQQINYNDYDQTHKLFSNALKGWVSKRPKSG